jgi:hypothetical protein
LKFFAMQSRVGVCKASLGRLPRLGQKASLARRAGAMRAAHAASRQGRQALFCEQAFTNTTPATPHCNIPHLPQNLVGGLKGTRKGLEAAPEGDAKCRGQGLSGLPPMIQKKAAITALEPVLIPSAMPRRPLFHLTKELACGLAGPWPQPLELHPSRPPRLTFRKDYSQIMQAERLTPPSKTTPPHKAFPPGSMALEPPRPGSGPFCFAPLNTA